MAKIAYTKDAMRSLKGLPRNRRDTVLGKIRLLTDDFKAVGKNVKKLKGSETWRLRVGDYRVIFDRDGETIRILAVAPRGKAYR